MNYWARYVTRVAVRRVVAILVFAFLAWSGIGRAYAEYSLCGDMNSSTAQCPDRGAAYNHARMFAEQHPANIGYAVVLVSVREHPYRSVRYGRVGGGGAAGEGYWPAVQCPAGTVWDGGGKTCFNSQACLDKAPMGKGLIGAVANAACINGCQFGPKFGDTTISFQGDKFVTTTKAWTPTGSPCTVDNPIPNTEEPQICHPSSAGQTACVKQDGEMCYSKGGGVASQFCWKPGETGEKTDGPDKQVTNAGDQPIPPSLNLPNGDTLVPVGTPTTTTVNNNGKTTTTTTNNYNTQHGTDAGKGPGQAEPGDGTGKPEGDGEGDGKGTATGGDCSGGWACAGDPIACAQLREANQSRCALEKGPGEGEGTGAEEGMGDGIGSLFGNGEGGTGRNVLDVLGGSIGQSKGCPPNPVIPLGTWGTIELPLDKICPHLQLMGTLMLGFAYLFAVKIMME